MPRRFHLQLFVQFLMFDEEALRMSNLQGQSNVYLMIERFMLQKYFILLLYLLAFFRCFFITLNL